MSVTVASFSGHAHHIEHSMDARPIKRPRKTSSVADDLNQNQHKSSSSQSHVFIAESLSANKRHSGKKATLSCCECRRLKLRCDRTFPCGSCKKRGVSDICPDGVLVSGKGTRFILANTEQLHSKIHDMSERIRKLEEELEAHSPSNALLQPEMLNVKSTVELYGVTQPKHGGSTIPVSLERNFEREHHDHLECQPVNDLTLCKQRDDKLEAEIQRLNSAFPQGDGRTSEGPNLQLREYIRRQLPTQQDTIYVWEQLRNNACWQSDFHPDCTFFDNLIHHCYTVSLEEPSPRRLALLLMILAIGLLVDLSRPADSPESEKYHGLARASLCEISLLEDTTVETVTALCYEMWFLLAYSNNKQSTSHAWALMGLTVKLAQNIGLHRNGAKSKVIPEEVEIRRNLFWELSCLDARLAISLGRPPSLSLQHSDCSRPMYMADPGVDFSESPHHYQSWKHSFYADCVSTAVDALSRPGIEYHTILELDKLVRNYPRPEALKVLDPRSRTLFLQQVSLAMAYESILLQIHRNQYMKALSRPEEAINKRHRYAPSIVAVFLGATRVIAAVEKLFRREPMLAVRVQSFWSNAFSAVVALALLIIRAPFTCLSPAGLQELERARRLFRAYAQVNPKHDAKTVAILESVITKAFNIFQRWYNHQEIPTLVFRHEDKADPFTDEMMTGVHRFFPAPSPPPTEDSFRNAHPCLLGVIGEAHGRATLMFPMRKPCKCSMASVAASCPPSHSWAPPPPVDPSNALLPQIDSEEIANPLRNVNFDDLPAVPASSPYHIGSNSINFELGALHPNTEERWMCWF